MSGDIETKSFRLDNPDAVASPALLIDPDQVAQNIQQMIAVVDGQTDRLRTHVKTHKMPEVIRMQMDAGIGRFKAATIAEVEMAASVGAPDVLLAYQPVGPNIGRLADLVGRYPDTSLAAIVDDLGVAKVVVEKLGDSRRPFRLFIDVDCGMHRTGIPLGEKIDRLRDWIESRDDVQYAGLHVYDGHIHDPPLSARTDAAMAIIRQTRQYDQSRRSPAIVGGGSPTFGIWAAETPWQCSPGTPLFWDVGYGSAHPELPFGVAAALLTRVISKPGENRLCLDLGYKAVASEMPLERRVHFPQFPDVKLIGQSEEHLVIETSRAGEISLGDALIGIPQHICPTVALHAVAHLVHDGRATGQTWRVTARDR